VKKGLSAKEKANRRLQGYDPNLEHEQQIPLHQSKKYQVTVRRKR